MSKMPGSPKRIMMLAIFCLVAVFGGKKVYNLYRTLTVRGTYAVQEPLGKKLEAYYNKLFLRSSVYDFLRKAYYTFGIPKKGLIHIGARYA
jgi:hypothetical protein